MNKKKAKKLFKKYVNNQCSPEERELLDRFLDSYQKDGSPWSEFEYDDELKEEIWSKVRTEMDQRNPKKKYDRNFYLKYAAVLICLVGAAILWSTFRSEKTTILFEDNPIILKTENNELKQLVSGGEETIRDSEGNIIASQNENEIVYYGRPKSKKLVYNEILVPKGKTFQLQLADGSLIHLNSDTSLKYPVSFVQEEERKVFLKGEAYFEVTKDTEHPFKVVSQGIDIQVLGTHFNVSCYGDEEAYTVLLEGSVAINKHSPSNDGSGAQIIQPGQKAALTDNNIVISDVNVDDYMGWRNGYLVFNNETFKNITGKIERHYNVSIENSYKGLDSVQFRGTFENETIEDLLNTFKESAGFDYQIINNRVVIKKFE